MRRFIAASFMALISASASGSERDFALSVKEDLAASPGSVVLKVELKYNGTSSVRVRKSDLPTDEERPVWITVQRFLDLEKKDYAYCPRPEDRVLIEDGSVNEVTIKSGQSFTQSIDLATRFTNIKEALGKCDLVVFWSYKPPGVQISHRLAGSIIIPADVVSAKGSE